MRLVPLSALALAASGVLIGEAAAAPTPFVGSYVLVQDDDGTAPRSDAQVTLAILPDGSVVLSASFVGGQPIVDKGSWSFSDNKLTLVLPESGKVANQSKVTLEGTTLTLPFRVFSDADGTSKWKRAATLSLRAFAGAPGAVPTAPTTALPPLSGTPSAPPSVTVNPALPSAVVSPTPSAPAPAAPANPASPAAPAGPKATRPPQVFSEANPANTAPLYLGRYQGTAIGAEVRYRKEGSFTLTAKHTATFWFEINDKNEVKGAGQITYALDADKKGTAEAANEVENFPTTYAPGGSLVLHEASLSGGSVTKDIELKGTYDPATNSVSLSIVSPLGDLVYEYESGGKRQTKPFPAWSPFPPDAPGSLEASPEGNVAVGLDLSGKGRRDKWQEYRFVWNATKQK